MDAAVVQDFPGKDGNLNLKIQHSKSGPGEHTRRQDRKPLHPLGFIVCSPDLQPVQLFLAQIRSNNKHLREGEEEHSEGG